MVRTRDVQGLFVFFIIGIALVGLGVMWSFGVGPFSTTGTAPAGQVVAEAPVQKCPDTLQTTLTLTLRNGLNDTARETFDATAYIYEVNDGKEELFATMTDTTQGTQTLECGSKYRIRLVSENSNGGASAKIVDVDAGDVVIGDNGKYAEFTAEGSNVNIELEGKQHGILQFKAYDNTESAWMYDSGDNSATDYEVSGVTFTSTTDNSTPTTVNDGDCLDIKLLTKTTKNDVDFSDFGFILLVDASTSVWEEPVVQFQGKEYEDAMVELDKYESRAYSNYEYAYIIDESIEDKDRTIDFDICTISGVNPGASDDITLAFASIGAVRETTGNSIRYSSVTDAASPSQIYDLQTVTFDVQ